MPKEELDYIYFKENQLVNIDFTTGCIDVKHPSRERYSYNIGSLNEDGYERVWCNGKLYMKHRLIYWLYYNDLPDDGEEIDHIDKVRNHNWITNLRKVTKAVNNTACNNRKFGKQLTEEQVHIICDLLANTDLSDLEISKQIGRSRGTIRDIKVRKTRTNISAEYSWKHRGY